MQPSRNHPINCGLATSQFIRAFAKTSIAERSADVTLVASPNVLRAGNSTQLSLNGMNLRRNVGAIIRTDISVQTRFLQGANSPIKLSQSSNLAIATPTTDPLLLEYQSSGPVTVTAEFENGEKAAGFFITSSNEDSSWDDLLSFASGSLGNHLLNQIAQRANGSTSPPGHLQIYSTYNGATLTYAKNTGCWAADLDFSGMSVGTQGSGGVGTVNAITPHHAIGAGHYAPNVGNTVYFCDANNNTISRTVTARAFVPDILLDCVVVRFNEPLPDTVKKYKALPATFTNYAPYTAFSGINTNVSLRGCPMIVTSHYNWSANWPLQRPNRYAYLYICNGIVAPLPRGLPGGNISASSIAATENIAFQSSVPNIEDYNGAPSGIRGGDSGSPLFFVINGELVITGVHVQPASGPMYSIFLSDIQTALDTLGPGNQTFETVDLSGFTNFAN